MDATTLTAAIRGAGLDALEVVSARLDEALSEVARATVSAVGDDDLDDEAILGQPAAIVVSMDGTPARFFHGIVVGFAFEGVFRGHRRRYRVDLAHELVRLDHRADVRVFQRLDARAIVAAVIEGAGVPPTRFSFSIARALASRDHCVQHRETDLAFVDRLLAHEGVAHVARHDEAGAHLRLFDHAGEIAPIDGGDVVALRADRAHGPGVHRFEIETRALPQRVTVGDYHEQRPGLDLTVTADVGPGGGYDHHEFPAGHRTPEEGQVIARLRAEAFEARRVVGRGESDRLDFRPGATFVLAGAGRAAIDRRYTLTRVEHEFVTRAADAGASPGPAYSNRFTCLPASTPYRPPRPARAPVRGVETAIVTAPGGSEVHTDSLGRLTARFAWDRSGSADGATSRPFRIVQAPIGGSMMIARAGWEVAVAYPFGDPDRPIAVARRYDGRTGSPYAYPGAAAQTAIQTASTPGGGAANEIRMSDGAGGQQLFVNASKDLDATVGNDKRATIGADDARTVAASSTTKIGGPQSVTIGAGLDTTVGAGESVHVGGARSVAVGGAETVTITGNATAVVGGADGEVVGGSHVTTSALGITRTVVGSYGLTVGGSMVSATGGSASLAVAGARSETVGGAKIVAAGSSIATSAVGALAMTVGGVHVQAAAGNVSGSAKGPSVITVGGVTCATAAGKISIKSNRVTITAGAVVNLAGGGAAVTLTAGSATFLGVVRVDASGGLRIAGGPNLLG